MNNLRLRRGTIPLLIALLLLAACGFHLRGYHRPSHVSAASVYLDTADNGYIAQSVRDQLRGGDTKVVKKAGEAQYVLHLARQKLVRRVLSVSPKTGKAEEYEITLSTLMTITGPDGEILADKEPVHATRDYTFDANAVLGKSSEEEVLQQNLADQIADDILSRLEAVTQRSSQ